MSILFLCPFFNLSTLMPINAYCNGSDFILNDAIILQASVAVPGSSENQEVWRSSHLTILVTIEPMLTVFGTSEGPQVKLHAITQKYSGLHCNYTFWGTNI